MDFNNWLIRVLLCTLLFWPKFCNIRNRNVRSLCWVFLFLFYWCEIRQDLRWMIIKSTAHFNQVFLEITRHIVEINTKEIEFAENYFNFFSVSELFDPIWSLIVYVLYVYTHCQSFCYSMQWKLVPYTTHKTIQFNCFLIKWLEIKKTNVTK